MASGRIDCASSGVISGSGLAMAKITGLSAIEATISDVTAPLALTPRKTSAPFIASSSVRASVATACADFHWFMPSVRPWKITPLVSHIRQLSCRAPIRFSSSRQAMPAAPAPLRTIRHSSIRLPVSSSALIKPAAQITAVPCWSSWNTGMSQSSFRRCSMMKHSGALMSSRLMPPKVGDIRCTALMISSASSVSSSMSMALTSAKRLNSTALPSITGLEASAPRLPMPRIAVPLEITATMLPLTV